MSEKQKTLKGAATVSGAGLHTGQEVTLTFRPAPINHGFKFRRIDLPDQPIIDADADLVTDTSRGTMLEHKGVRVSTVEHALAALVGMDLDNVLIDLDCQETPILDGSSKFYVDAIKEAGIEEQDAERKYFNITEILRYSDPEKKTEVLILPDDT